MKINLFNCGLLRYKLFAWAQTLLLKINNNYINKKKKMFEKKQINLKSPDLTKLQEVVIDFRTKIYIALGADSEEARSRYLSRIAEKNKLYVATSKTKVTT